MPNLIIALGAFNTFLAVAAGAFAAHALKNTLTAEYLNVFKTAADYHLIHGIGLIVVAILAKQNPTDSHTIIAALMFAGIVFFCGSLYVLAITGTKWLGMITPIGGVCFLLAWLLLGIKYVSQ